MFFDMSVMRVSRTTRFPLQWKVSALVVGALVVFALATGVSNYLNFRRVLKGEALARARAISLTLASAVVEMPDSAVGSPDYDRSVDDVIAQVRVYQALGGPGFASHVLALRASAGAARGPGADAGHFEVGGAAGSLESLTGLTLFGGTSLFYPVRGYPEVSRSGRVAWSASAEYRVPLALVNRGAGAWPISLDRVVGALFADAGNAWGPELGIQGYQNPRRSTLASVGAEVSGQFLAGWTTSMLLRGGVGFPLVEGDGPRGYVRLGLSF